MRKLFFARSLLAEESPAEESLAEASQWGALSVVELDGRGEVLASRLRELARYPGVALAVVHGELPADFQRAAAAPNLLLAQPLASGEPALLHSWADLAWVAAEDVREFTRLASAIDHIPIIAVRPLSAPLPIDESRAACDRLQRDLAPIGQFAGYVV
jgi:hypothetical protein